MSRVVMSHSSYPRISPVRGTLSVLLLAVLMFGFVTACGSSGNDQRAETGQRATVDKVDIKSFAFSPSNFKASVGDKLEVTNEDSAPHTLTADDGAFDTGNLTKGQEKTLTLDKAGTFAYHCTVHPYMKGTITVSQ